MGRDNGGAEGDGFFGTTIKDTWTKSKGLGSGVGGGDGWGGGSDGEWRQLYLNNNKKRK